MDTFDLAIHGHGLVPALLAAQVIGAHQELRLLLLCTDRTVGGDALEPVIVSRLDPPARALVEPFAVARWSGYAERHAGGVVEHDEAVELLDPVQVWLELQRFERNIAAVAACGEVSHDAGVLNWQCGAARVERLISIGYLIAPPGTSRIVGLDAATWLHNPVLIDTTAAAPGDPACQYIPLGDERLLIRELAPTAGALAIEELLNRFATL